MAEPPLTPCLRRSGGPAPLRPAAWRPRSAPLGALATAGRARLDPRRRHRPGLGFVAPAPSPLRHRSGASGGASGAAGADPCAGISGGGAAPSHQRGPMLSHRHRAEWRAWCHRRAGEGRCGVAGIRGGAGAGQGPLQSVNCLKYQCHLLGVRSVLGFHEQGPGAKARKQIEDN